MAPGFAVTAFAEVDGRPVHPPLGQGESVPMSNPQKPGESSRDVLVERRQQPRGGADSTDWETIALKRVERHVELLSRDLDSSQEGPSESGWEETVLLALRRRLRDLKSQ